MELSDFLTQMGLKVRAARKKAKMSQMKLGKLALLHHSSVSQIECGNAESKISTLIRIANVLNVDVKDFL
jgi:transcriptional regulator with XRE-family HTH domain